MTIDRAKEKEAEINPHSIITQIKLIDHAIEDIYTQLLNTLKISSSNSKDINSVCFLLFEYLWPKLDKQILFESLEKLDLHYVSFSKSLDLIIVDFFNLPMVQAKKLNQKIPDTKKKLLLNFINVYHVLTKIKFLLSKIKFLDLKTAYDSISYKFSYNDLTPVRETISLLDILNEEIPAKLSFVGYSKNKSVVKKMKNLDDELLIFIDNLLSRLPTNAQLNQVIDGLQQAKARQNKHGVEENKKTLNEYIILIQETKKMISEKVITFNQKEINILYEMAKERESIKTRIIEIEQQDYFHALKVLSSDEEKKSRQEIFNGILLSCNQQSTQWFFDGPWEATSQKLGLIFHDLDNNFNLFMKEHVPNINKIVYFLRALNSRIEQLDEVSHQLDVRLNKLQDIWQDSERAIMQVENTLMGHLKEQEELLPYCSSFLLRHWWKMMLGGATGGGGSGGLSVLLALKGGPLGVFCIVGTLIGISFGAGSGLLYDHFCAETKDQEGSSEKDQLLLSDEGGHELIDITQDSRPNASITKGWWSSLSIWKNRNEVQDETQQIELKLKSYH